MTSPLNLFPIYETDDEDFLQELDRRLAGLRREGVIERLWSKKQLLAGDEERRRLVQELERADIVLLLLSPALLNSDDTFEQMERALARMNDGLVRVIPVLARHVDIQGHRLLSGLKALPRDGRPISAWENQDAAWHEVVTGVRLAVEEQRHERRRVADVSRLQAQVDRLVVENRDLRDKLDKAQPQAGKVVDLAKQLGQALHDSHTSREEIKALKEKNQELASRIASLTEKDRKIKEPYEKRSGLEICSRGIYTNTQNKEHLFWSFYVVNTGDVPVRISAFEAKWKLTYKFHTDVRPISSATQIPDLIPTLVHRGGPLVNLLLEPEEKTQEMQLTFDVNHGAVSSFVSSLGISIKKPTLKTWSTLVTPLVTLDYICILLSKAATTEKLLEPHPRR